MALNIDINSASAVKQAKTLSDSLQVSVEKIKQMREEFAKIDGSKLKELKKEISDLSKLQITNKTQIDNLTKQNALLRDQVSVAGKLKTAVKGLGAAKKQTDSVVSQATANERAVKALQEEQIRVSAKLRAATVTNVAEFRKLIKTKEQLKIATDQAVVAAQKEILVDDKKKRSIRVLNEATRLEIKITEDLIRVQAELSVRKKKGVSETLRLTAVQKEEIRVSEELVKTKAKLKVASSVEGQELKKLTAQLKALQTEEKKATKSTKDFSGAMRAGNLHAAEFRAALNALGAGFGIFTGATVFAAAAVFGVVKSLKEGITAFAQFDFAMDRAGAVMEANRVQTEQLRTTVRDLAATTVFTAREVSEGLIFLGQAGQTTSEAMQTLEPTLRLAQIGMIGMQQAADQVTNVMAAFNIQAVELGSVVDLLSVIVTSSNTNMSQLAQAISFVGPAAQATNTSLRDTAVILGFFANAGVKASRAGTALRRGIANLSNPTDKITSRLLELGVNTIDPLTGQMKSMVDIIQELSGAGADLSDVFTIFGTRAGPAFAAAIVGNASALDELLKKTEDTAGATERLVERLEDNQISDYRKALAAGEEALISFGDSIKGVVGPAILAMTTGLKALASAISSIVPVLGFAIKTFAVFFGIGLVPKLLLMTKGFVGLTAAVRFNSIAMAKGATTMTAMQLAGTSLAFTARRLGLAFKAMLGPLGLIVASGLAVFFASSKTESERFEESLQKNVETLSKLESLSKAISGKDFSIGTDQLATQLDVLIDGVKKSRNALGPTIRENLVEVLGQAEAKAGTLKRTIKALGTELVGGKDNVRLVTKELTEQEKVIKRNAENSLKFNLGLIKLTKQQIADAEKLGVADKTAATALEEQAQAAIKLNKELKEKQLLEQGTTVSIELEKQLFELRRRNDEALQGGNKTIKDRLLISLKGLDAERKLQEANLSSGNLGKDAADKVASQIEENLKDGEKVIANFFDGIVALRNRFDSKLARAEKNGLINTTNLETVAGNISKVLTGSAQDFNEFLTDLVNVAEQKRIEQITKAAASNRLIGKARLDSLIEFNKAELQEVDRANALILQASSDRRDKQISDAKTEFSVRQISLQDFINATVNAERALAESTLAELRQKETILTKQRENIEQLKSGADVTAESIKLYNSSLVQNTKDLLDNAAAQDKANQEGKAAQEQARAFAAEFGKEAQKDAQTFLNQQEAQLAVLNGLKDGYLSTAEALLAYRIEELRLSDAYREGQPEMVKQVKILEEQRAQMHSNSIAIKGLEDTWVDSQNTMAGEALSAAQQMATAFEDFLINPTKEGFEDLGKTFLNLIAQILAKKAVLSLFNTQGDGGKGLGDIFTEFFKDVGGSATGGSFRVGGSGGIDSQLFAQKVTPGEIITISNPNGGDDRKAERNSSGISTSFNNTINISGSGDNAETAKLIDRGLKELESRITRQQQRQQKFMGAR